VQIASELNEVMQRRRWTQQAVCRGSGVSQSAVSRLLNGQTRRLSRRVKAICKYADIPTEDTAALDPRKNPALMDALRNAWNGSDEHARFIAKVIRALADTP
jgi:transcriptional regulator with XRE-family HTH domain